MFPAEVLQGSDRAANGEIGWHRERVALVADLLAQSGPAILGGELWWMPHGVPEVVWLVPQRSGPPAVYHWETTWETTREDDEAWATFVDRAAGHAKRAAVEMPAPAARHNAVCSRRAQG